MEKRLQESVIRTVLGLFGLDTGFSEQREYIHQDERDWEDHIKVIVSVLLENGGRVVLKLLREGDLPEARRRIEAQSAFSELMRRHGIKTPRRYRAEGKYCAESVYHGLPCLVTVEDWCGDAIKAIDARIARKIGELMARMHSLSLENRCEIGCGTLFSAAYWNDVDDYERFCGICRDERLDRSVAERIKAVRNEKLAALRAVWDRLPRAAVQGDISINNLVDGETELAVFDYNNAGDEVLISDLVLEGLLTAYEMELPEGAGESCRETLFPALLSGYLSVRTLSEEEAAAAWDVYTVYHALWFSRIHFGEESLEELVKRGDYAGANRLLGQILADITEKDDGRFRK